jgi:lysyl-tRNA synthetase class 2
MGKSKDSANVRYWESISAKYSRETRISTEDFHYGPLLPGDSELKLLPEIVPGMTCLELGCGGAQNSIFLAKQGAICTGVDISSRQLSWAESLCKREGVQVKLLEGDMASLPSGLAHGYDLVHSCHALSFAEDVESALSQVCSFVRPGGWLVLSTSHPLTRGEWLDLDGEVGIWIGDYYGVGSEERSIGGGDVAESRSYGVGWLSEQLISRGMQVCRVLEPRVDASRCDSSPYWSRGWKEHLPELERIPYTVIYVARRPENVLAGSATSDAASTASLRSMRKSMEIRAKLMAATREFFDGLGFMEIVSPVRLPAPALEDYIDAEPSGSHWLRTSPELHMKRLLAAGYERIYQLGPCFRYGELGRRHLPEFQMLEWYRLGGGWRDVQADAVELIRSCIQAARGTMSVEFRGETIDFGAEWDQITVDEAFEKYAGISLDQAIEQGEFEERLCESVEPNLGHGKPTFLTEYPLACSGLSQEIPGRPDRVERWEVYVAGLELGNACTELVDVAEQRRRFQATAELRGREGRQVYPVDEAFMAALEEGIPRAAGVAIGFDRLVMIATGIDDIRQIAFQ